MLAAIIAYFITQNNKKHMSTDEAKKEECGCGCRGKKNKTLKVVVTVCVIAALVGAAYWAYSKGYVSAAIEKVKELTAKKA